jgi:PAB-dependent poly(A)-specific ribonuclease subunit 3
MHQAAFGAIDIWSKIKQPNIVQVKEAFTTLAFNDNCMSHPVMLL